MRAYRLNGTNAPLTLLDQPATKAGPGEVLVDLKAATLNYRDLIVQEGRYGGEQKHDLVPLSDGAGIITAIGDGVSRDRLGQRVVLGFMPGWLDGAFSARKQATALGGGFVDGVLREQIVLPAAAAITFPETWTFEEAAAYPCAGVTAWNCLFGGRGLRPGDSVLVEGTGGVSTFALQMARAAGARVIVTSSSDEKLAGARRLGAEATINYRTTPNWGEVAADMAGGEGVDLVVEVGGSGTLNQALRAARPGGEVALVGVLTGFSGEIDTGAILMKAIDVRGVYVGSVADLGAAVATGVKPLIDEAFPFMAAQAAYDRLRSGQHRGKVAIKIAA
ncbi:D-arabinose 1-dehydrogenase, Zn-dependent alcohol dehydrogenase family [Bosea sp. CRIB-10]|uniref:zinc-dependent alcohol dehydrogenase family protein n=1 Tax=Bosea sp. CRIB-10 TaxID=378404 RepID=UPI0008F1C825|nr:NAD(P)-dependent alcohol dehydrogenase [Bosea sp. CRIB-10]SFD43931.1 D-arabinose 1-dehydrogenase, Zn-dependent alcohol dehydrogenase family [Bosea sp. CRIB-10]